MITKLELERVMGIALDLNGVIVDSTRVVLFEYEWPILS